MGIFYNEQFVDWYRLESFCLLQLSVWYSLAKGFFECHYFNDRYLFSGSLAAATPQASSSSEATDNKRKKSNALKLGQKRTPRTSPGASPRAPRGLGNSSNPATSTPNQSIDLTSGKIYIIRLLQIVECLSCKLRCPIIQICSNSNGHPDPHTDPLVLPEAESRASSPSVEQISEEDSVPTGWLLLLDSLKSHLSAAFSMYERLAYSHPVFILPGFYIMHISTATQSVLVIMQSV